MIWNPTEGIDLGFFMIRFYSLTWVTAFALGWYIMKFIFDREKLSIKMVIKVNNFFFLELSEQKRKSRIIFQNV